MTLEEAKAICDFLNNHEIECSVREGYSGRGMYGKTVPGLIVEDPMDVAWAIGWLKMVCPKLRTDSLGFDTICY